MPTRPDESINDEALYPDDLSGEKLTIREYLYWDAQNDEDREELPDTCKFGLWLPVTKTGTDLEQWAAAPRCVREYLEEQGAEQGDSFEVMSIEKGPGDSDPYAVEMRMLNGETEQH